MSNNERFGVFLPSFVWEDDGPQRARGIVDFARAVEDLGFDSIFITRSRPLPWWPHRVKLGTSVMALPIREPVLLAKQLATLQFLSENRVILGAGIGWYPPEYAATRDEKSERGLRADEILDIVP